MKSTVSIVQFVWAAFALLSFVMLGEGSHRNAYSYINSESSKHMWKGKWSVRIWKIFNGKLSHCRSLD